MFLYFSSHKLPWIFQSQALSSMGPWATDCILFTSYPPGMGSIIPPVASIHTFTNVALCSKTFHPSPVIFLTLYPERLGIALVLGSGHICVVDGRDFNKVAGWTVVNQASAVSVWMPLVVMSAKVCIVAAYVWAPLVSSRCINIHPHLMCHWSKAHAAIYTHPSGIRIRQRQKHSTLTPSVIGPRWRNNYSTTTLGIIGLRQSSNYPPPPPPPPPPYLPWPGLSLISIRGTNPPS